MRIIQVTGHFQQGETHWFWTLKIGHPIWIPVDIPTKGMGCAWGQYMAVFWRHIVVTCDLGTFMLRDPVNLWKQHPLVVPGRPQNNPQKAWKVYKIMSNCHAWPWGAVRPMFQKVRTSVIDPGLPKSLPKSIFLAPPWKVEGSPLKVFQWGSSSFLWFLHGASASCPAGPPKVEAGTRCCSSHKQSSTVWPNVNEFLLGFDLRAASHCWMLGM